MSDLEIPLSCPDIDEVIKRIENVREINKRLRRIKTNVEATISKFTDFKGEISSEEFLQILNNILTK